MKTPLKTVLLLSAALLLPAAMTHADDGNRPARRQGEVNHRLRRQRHRERIGRNDRSLTPAQTAKLRKDDRAIHKEEHDMRKANVAAGGTGQLTKEQKQSLNKQENGVSKEIYQDRHDSDSAPASQ